MDTTARMIPMIQKRVTILGSGIPFLEVVVYGAHQEDAPAFPVLSFGIFEPGDLHDHAQVFDQEDAAEEGMRISLRMITEITARMPPRARLPVSPMKIWAG